MRICVLQSSYENSNSPFKDHDAYADPSQFHSEHTFETALIKKSTALQQLTRLAEQKFDIFINLCDGAPDEDRAGVEVIQALEKLGLPYTGANAQFYEPTKQVMKMAAHNAGVHTPAFSFAYSPEDVEEAAQHLTFPLICKHFDGYGSIGMTKDSKVHTPEALRTQAQRFIDTYGGCLIEEFIEGKEYTVLVAENPEDPNNPVAFAPVEIVFRNGLTFKSFDIKWIDFNAMSWSPCTDPELASRLQEDSKKVFVAMRGVGYGRTDIRVDKEGKIYFLEMNPNCGMFYPLVPIEGIGSADFILLNDPIGHKGFLDHIIKCALIRYQKAKKCYEIRFKKGTGYGLYANREIGEGEVILEREQSAHYLRTHSCNEFSTCGKLCTVSFPITEHISIASHPDPTEWRPLIHSCDPNAWLSGLNIVARRRIRKGEAITIDYATFGVQSEFECGCGTSLCRGRFTGSDYLHPFLDERYEDHMSDYVKTKRKALFGTQRVLP